MESGGSCLSIYLVSEFSTYLISRRKTPAIYKCPLWASAAHPAPSREPLKSRRAKTQNLFIHLPRINSIDPLLETRIKADRAGLLNPLSYCLVKVGIYTT